MKKIINIRYYIFPECKYGSKKNCSKYFFCIIFFNKYNIDFRFMNQDGSFSLRCENLHYFIYKYFKQNKEPF